MERVYICIDLKSYYASVECVDRGLNPLRANLLVADASRTDKTICLAVSPNLKAHGVSSRPRLFEAKEQIRFAEAHLHYRIHYLIAPPRMQHYIDISTKIYGIYLGYVAPEDIHVYSIDECFIDATPYVHLYGGSARNMAMVMIRAVLRETGITATVGIGTNMYLAKVAMDIEAKHQQADQDGVRIAELNEQSYRALLWDHRPLTDFWQVGPGTARRLLHIGVHTMGELARLSVSQEEMLYRIFGINAELIVDHAWGIEPCTMDAIKSYRTREKSISQGQVLSRPYTYQEARVVLREMAEQLALRLESDGYMTSEVAYTICFDPKSLENGFYCGPVHLDYYGRLTPNHAGKCLQLTQATMNQSRIINTSLSAYDQQVNPELLIRTIHVAAMKLSREQYHQLDFFSDYREEERERGLQRVMLEIRERCGPGLLFKGTSLDQGATAIERSRQIGGHRA